MQPRRGPRRPERMPILPGPLRAMIALAFALAVAWVPLSQVAACSCAMAETAEAIRRAQLAFTGTVVDQRETGLSNELGDQTREYAFAVDRSSRPTDPVTTILAGSGGASCGITFSNGEEWLIVSNRGKAGMETHLCAGNVRLSDIGLEERAAIAELLRTVPGTPSAAPEPSTPAADSFPLLAGSAAVLLIGVAAYVAFRRDRAR